MGRKAGFDGKKISGIISALARNPEGLWLRQLARELNLAPATVSKYLNGILKPLVEETALGPEARPMLKLIRLKPFVMERIHEGKSISEIMKTLKIFQNIGQ